MALATIAKFAIPALAGAFLGSAKGKQPQAQVQQAPTMSPQQQQVMNQTGDFLGGQIGNFHSSREDAERFYQDSIHNPAVQAFQNDIIPQINQQFVGPGTFWGNERTRSISDAGTQLGGQLAGVRAQTMMDSREADRQYQLNQINQALAYMGLPSFENIVTAPSPTLGSQIAGAGTNILAAMLAGGYFKQD